MEKGTGQGLLRRVTPDRQVQTAIVIFLILAAVASRVVTPLWVLTRPLTAYLWWIVLIATAWGQGVVLIRLLVPDDLRDEPELRARRDFELPKCDRFEKGAGGSLVLVGLVALINLTLVEIMRQGLTKEEMKRELVQAGFSHILFNPFEMRRLGGKSPFLRLNGEEESILEEFFSSRARLVFEDRGVYVFDIT